MAKLGRYASSRGITVRAVRWSDVQAQFASSGRLKQEIAVALSHVFPELEPRLPRPRELWTSEDERMNIFDAVALAVVALGDAEGTARCA